MSGCQAYDIASSDGCFADGNPAEGPAVIARFPDLGSRTNHKPARRASNEAAERRWTVPSKKVLGAAGTTVFLIVCLLIFYNSESDPDSWEPVPPAVSAPEAPLWNGETVAETAIASKPSRPDATSIKLDEVLPQQTPQEKRVNRPLSAEVFLNPPAVNAESAILGVKEPVNSAAPGTPTRTWNSPASKQTEHPASKHPARATSNRPLIIGTPAPQQNSTLDTRNLAALSDTEYYWAVRRRSEAAAYQTAAKPEAREPQNPPYGQADNHGTAPAGIGKARLNGVIEPPSVRVY